MLERRFVVVVGFETCLLDLGAIRISYAPEPVALSHHVRF
jgi:hypothetical protein